MNEGIRITNKIVLIAIIALFAAFAVPAVSADYSTTGFSVATNVTGTMHGDIYYEMEPVWPGTYLAPGSYQANISFANVPSGVKIAKLYTGVWGGSPFKTGNITVKFNTNTFATREIKGNSGSPCGPDDTSGVYGTGCGVWANVYNVTDDVNSGTNTVNITTKAPSTAEGCSGSYGWDGRIYPTALVVVYEDESKPNMTYWLNEGTGLLLTGASDCGPGYALTNFTAHFNGTIPNNANVTKLWTFGFPNQCLPHPQLNGNDIGDPDYTESWIGRPALYRWDNLTDELDKTNPSNNSLYYNDTSPQYERVMSAVFMVSTQSGPDLTVTDVDIGTPRPDTNFIVKATIKNVGNEDAGAFNVSLFVNSSFYAKNTSITGLNAGASTTVSFDVNLPKGCHSFRVFADSDNDIAESDETNNNMTVDKKQVGYVIEVKSNSDFEKLNTSGTYALPSGCFKNESGTYYIQNLTGSYTIENCAGNGISIENTDVHFVIKNCTIENCTLSGVYMRNLSNGTINGSCVIQNNSAYGINVYGLGDVSNTKLINITDSTITENGIYGIELIGYNCTVRDNTLQNNSDYGVYVNGNDNSIYENEFICNNRDFSARTSQGCEASGTGNSWNTSTIGNNWTDWDDNSGAPGNYSIDCGTNINDSKPRGLYVFSCNASEDKWAFRNQTTGTSPSDPNTEFTDAQYDKIAEDDDVRQEDQTSTPGRCAAHRLNFSIDEAAADIDKINVTWNGIGWSERGVAYNGTYLYIYNFSAGSYGSPLDSNTVGTEETLTGGVASSISSYINAGNVTVLVKQRGVQTGGSNSKSHIETDYVQLVITPE